MVVIAPVEKAVGGKTKWDREVQLQRLFTLARLASIQYPLLIIYCALRGLSILNSQLSTNDSVWAAWLLLISEVGFLGLFLHRLRHSTIRISSLTIAAAAPWTLLWNKYLSIADSAQLREPLRVTGNDIPFIDVFLPCAGESIPIILDTVRAACASDYPQDKFRVVVLDDAARSDDSRLAIEIKKLAKTWGNLHYSPHSSDRDTFSKASNLNSGLDFVEPLGPGEFVAGVDADMIVDPCWLRALLPALLQNSNIGAIGSHQGFYNIPRDDPLHQNSYWSFNRYLWKPCGDINGNCIVGGSGWMVRRKALDSVGRFPESATEDVLLTMTLLAKGWKTAAIPDSIQHGLFPETLDDYLRQQCRWVAGCTDTVSMLSQSLAKKLPWMQRQRTTMPFYLYANTGLIPAISSLLLPIVLVSQHSLVPYTKDWHFEVILALAFAQYSGLSIQGTVQAIVMEKKSSSLDCHLNMWPSPQTGFALLRYTLPQVFPNRTFSGAATGVSSKRRNEFNITHRARISLVLWEYSAWIHIVFICICGAALTTRVWGVLDVRSEARAVDVHDRFYTLLSSCAFPPLLFNLYHAVTQATIPLRYAISIPQRLTNRETFLERDQKTMLAYPKLTARDLVDPKSLWGFESVIAAGLIAFIFGPMFAWMASAAQ